MSAALNSRPDASLNHSSGTIPELSLSIGSGILTPAKLRVPSASSGTTAPSSAPLSTPSPPVPTPYTRRKGDVAFSNNEEDGDLLNTPGDRQWGDTIDTPVATRAKRTRSNTSGIKGANLTL